MTTFIRKSICIPAILLCAFTGTAAAGQFDLIVNGRSHHVNSDYDWNENNYGIGLEYQFDSSSRWIWSVNGNAFVDSQNRMSYMGGGGAPGNRSLNLSNAPQQDQKADIPGSHRVTYFSTLSRSFALST